MDKVIATVVGIILVLGLISYAILGQVAGVKDTGDKALIEQSKINQMLEEPDVVTGSTVRNYIDMGDDLTNYLSSGNYTTGSAGTYTELHIAVQNVEDGSYDDISSKSDVKDGAVYRMRKFYNPDGDLWVADFQQIDLSS